MELNGVAEELFVMGVLKLKLLQPPVFSTVEGLKGPASSESGRILIIVDMSL